MLFSKTLGAAALLALAYVRGTHAEDPSWYKCFYQCPGNSVNKTAECCSPYEFTKLNDQPTCTVLNTDDNRDADKNDFLSCCLDEETPDVDAHHFECKSTYSPYHNNCTYQCPEGSSAGTTQECCEWFGYKILEQDSSKCVVRETDSLLDMEKSIFISCCTGEDNPDLDAYPIDCEATDYIHW
ncbi:hypothetical protein BDB00DRAFT_811667 [Zychaea mexicana]|uniref:uncharacterized protein n=1 Tax=Zychaea mexicana TaxID=64656 RepID=UPI0022FED36D|nr:uncharacterized protein BDB00DRAFT_811667 [Zychaea mexicana]KAI9495773.1 hypothetical protein BDB00DRAFT_811667 [Zychaea mexicana]